MPACACHGVPCRLTARRSPAARSAVRCIALLASLLFGPCCHRNRSKAAIDYDRGELFAVHEFDATLSRLKYLPRVVHSCKRERA